MHKHASTATVAIRPGETRPVLEHGGTEPSHAPLSLWVYARQEESEGVNEPGAPALGPESSPIEAQSADGSIDPSSICNEEGARFRAQPEGPGYPRALGRVAPLAQVA